MENINLLWILLFIICLMVVDKVITVMNIKAVEKNFPKVDKFSIEKNPLAKQFFLQFGLFWGTILYTLFSFITFLISLVFLRWTLSLFHVQNAFSISLWVLTIWYFFVIGNNIFFLLKFSKVIP